MAGIVLAGGQSRRMGQDKARLAFGGDSLLTRVVAVVGSATGRVIVVVDSAERFGPDELPRCVELAIDRHPGAGPLGGLITGLTCAGPGYHAAVACDMPYVNPAVLRLLIDRVEGFDAAVPEIGGRLEPLCAAYDAGCTEALLRELDADRLGLQMAVATLSVNRIPESELRAVDPDLISFTNINTPEDYVRAIASG